MMMFVHKLSPWKDFLHSGGVRHGILINTDAIARIDRLKYGGSKITFLNGSKLKVSQETIEFT